MSALYSESHPSIFGDLTESARSVASQGYRPISPTLFYDAQGILQVQPLSQVSREGTPDIDQIEVEAPTEYMIVRVSCTSYHSADLCLLAL
jgi:hypothetical protein